MTQHAQREDKYDIDDAGGPPDLGKAFPEASTDDIQQLRLVTEYFDTDDRALLDFGATLRRRAGDENAGWRLDVPAGRARIELSAPESATAEVPAELTQVVAGLTAGQPLRRLATVDTARTVRRWRDGAGQVLAEIADDRVSAAAPGADGAQLSSWRELGVELGPAGDRELLRRISKRLAKRGARPAIAADKLSRAVGAAAAPTVRTDGARSVLLGYLVDQRHRLLAGDVALRRRDDTAIHKTRVAARRLRSALRVFGDLVEPARAAQLDRELSWYAGILGGVRDPQVMRARFAKAVAAVPEAVRLGPVAARIEAHLLGEQLRSRTELERAMAGGRYAAMVRDLRSWTLDPPFASGARITSKMLRKAADKAGRKAERRLREGREHTDPDSALHRARKAAKRARYAADLAAPAVGHQRAKRRSRHFERIQAVLGDHQDSVIAADLLRRLGAATVAQGDENGFTYGILYQRELDRGARARARLAEIT